MNRTQAQTIVRDTFTSAFDKAKFLNLTRNLVNHLDESKAFARNSQYVKDAFKEHVARFERLGTYTSPDKETLDVLVVHLTRDSKLEHTRTAIRNFVADHLKERDDKDAALVAFVSPSETQWRFSYVRMDYAQTETPSGKVGVETKLTPARRFSYIVGAGEACHTAQTRFLDLLQDTENDPTLAQIEEAFSVEAVTKEFFTRYVELFDEITKHLDKLVDKDKTVRDDFKSKNISTVDFAKKLLGQIVFLYFLQKKGWLGVERGKNWGTGPRDFMRRLAKGEYRKYDNFFNEILEPLFYESLALKRDADDWCKRFNCRIPFLNGGLFEPIGNYDWHKTDVVIPNRLFTNSDPVEEGVIGTGVFDVFDRYNFTVNEAEPLEKEVAIDPEMLGKVFENLIEENRRKGLGAFYTPREIVHYMCQESLINYLDTAINTREESVVPEKPQQGKMFDAPDPQQKTLKMTAHKEIVPRADIETFVHLGEQISHYESVPTEYRIKMPKSIEPNAQAIDDAVKNIAVCDPAVGSGAFPVGMMTEIVRARLALNSYLGDKKRSSYDFKRHAIQNCLYGVDIDAGAVEIAKLRLWLSLVVDEEDVKEIKPLPNLDYKIVAGNSLLGLPFKSQRLGKIEELKQKFFDETDHDKKAKIKAQIDEQLVQVFAASKKSLGYQVDFDFQVFFSEVFQRKGGFDAVIGNPPYLESRHSSFSDSLKDALQLAVKSRWGDDARQITRGADLLIYFFETGLSIIKRTGNVVLITQNSWLDTEYGKKFQDFLLKKTWVQGILDSDFKYFDSSDGPNINTVISIFVGKQPNENGIVTFARVHQNFSSATFSIGDPGVEIPSSLADVRRYASSSTLLETTKWGMLLVSPEEFFALLDVLNRKAVQIEQLKEHQLSIGQGLNLTSDYFLAIEDAKRLQIPRNAIIPILTSDDDAPFNIATTKYVLANRKKIDPETARTIKQHDFALFNPDSTGKRQPILTMPRGLGRHFCAFNSINAFSSSGVDIYDLGETMSEEEQLNLWLILNSSVCWLWRELSGRKNLGGGMLKAEAVDMKSIPIYMNLNSMRDVKSIFGQLQQRHALETIAEIDSAEHRKIDRLVFEYLGLSQKQSDRIVALLKSTISSRTKKSKT
jgi:type I restriction-modification system DNA methylase subunit